MAARRQSKLARLSQMDWEEVRVRLGQEFHKRRDLLMYRMGARAGTVRLNLHSTAKPGQFFFAFGESAARAELLRQQLPAEASEILRQADEICGHRFRLLGYEDLVFNLGGGSVEEKEIDWHLDPVHGKRAPLAPWFKIPFLDFTVVGDHKITWELNRHQHLVTLAKAWLLSGDEKYTRELMAQWRSWMKANPYPLGINWASALEVAFRSLSWVWVDQLLAGTDGHAEFRAEMLPSLAFHGRYIDRYLSTYFSPNTHLLGEAVALFFLGTLYPQMPRAEHWKKSGWRIALREAERQVRPDGVYFEQSLYYHVYALDFFLHARWLAARNEIEIPPANDAVLGRMLDVIAALAAAGPAEGFGDDDGGRVFNPRRNRTEHMTDPLALGAVIYSKSNEFFSARLTEEAIWLFGNQAVEELPTGPSSARAGSPANALAFRDGGVYLLTDSEPYAQAMAVDAGPQGVGRSGHGHADALSLRLTMDGRRCLVDSGSGVYIAKDPADRNVFRGTGAHNTLRVDAMAQAVADGPFSWTQIPTTQAENWVTGKSFTYFVGSHNGYERLADPVVHRRHVLKIAGGMWLVRDVALGHAEHELEILWHFAPGLEVRSGGLGRVEISKVDPTPDEASLTLIVPEETIWQTATEVTKTMLSPAYGAFQSAPLVRCHARVGLPAEIATVFVARRGAILRKDEPRLAGLAQTAVQVYKIDYHQNNESHGFFFALGDEEWSFGPWSSDARVLYYGVVQEKLAHLIVIGGTHVAWQRQPLLQAPGPANFFEWRKQDAAMNAATGEFSVTALFQELTGASSSLQVSNRSSSFNAEKS